MVEAMPLKTPASPAHPPVETIWEWLRDIKDPEIPVVSVVDLGIVRNVQWSEISDSCAITITPTYSGCPATAVIQERIREELAKHGVPRVNLRIQLSPAWTTDWLSPHAIETLRTFGIAPPAGRVQQQSTSVLRVLDSEAEQKPPACPRCGSTRTTKISQFGSTLCKALYRCQQCLEPFDYFKCH